VSYEQQERWLCMERGDVTVGCNLGETSRRLAGVADERMILGSRGAVTVKDGALMIPPNTAVIIIRRGMRIGCCMGNVRTLSWYSPS
jgi:hypothetical protein